MDAVIGFLVLYVLYKLYKKYSSPDKIQTKQNYSNIAPTQRMTHSNQPKSSKFNSAKWYGFNEEVSVRKYVISGFVYVGENLLDRNGYENDASLINPKLSVSSAEPWEAGEEMGYWPHYATIPAKCRGAYLKWLSTGRTEPEAYIGYVFLFFYGLERRLFHDEQRSNISKEERFAIVNEVQRLLSIYGENRSFRGYANTLLAMEWIVYQSSDSFDAVLPKYLQLEDSVISSVFQVQLARAVHSKKAISAHMALQWVRLHPEYGLKTVARRCPKEFLSLFLKRYNLEYSDGIIVPPNKKKLAISYRSASPSLYGFTSNFEELSDPFMLSAPLKKIAIIANYCTDELDAYSRFLGRKGNRSDSLAALALLPKDILNDLPEMISIQKRINDIILEGTGLVKTSELYQLIDEQSISQASKKDAEHIASIIEKIGFGVVPDVRYYGVRPDIDSKVVIFDKGHGVDFKPSNEFKLVSTIIRLGALVSQCDGISSIEEKNILKNTITGNRNLTIIEKDSLNAYLYWCLTVPQGVVGIKQKLEGLGSAEKLFISRILIAVAYADGILNPKEVTQLEKLYISLGLDKAQVVNDLHKMTIDAPITMASKDEDIEYSFPKFEDNLDLAPLPLSLDKELIKLKELETQQVRHVLETIFIDDENALQKDAAMVTEHVNPITSLDSSHQGLLAKLITKSHWERKDLEELCNEYKLMPDGALEVLNEWAYTYAQAPLIEDDDPLYIDIELAKEIMHE